MHLRRGRAADPASDRAATDALVGTVAETREPGLRVWYPHRHVAFGRRDARTEEYDRARSIARDRGFPPLERAVGGRAVAFTGTVLAFVYAEPADASEPGVDSRYERGSRTLTAALGDCGAEVHRGEPADSFCPGTHSLQTDGGKVAGLAQRVRRDVAVVGGVVLVDDGAAVASVLEPVYDALDVPFDPASVGCLAGSARGLDPATVRDRVEAAFVGDRAPAVRSVRET